MIGNLILLIDLQGRLFIVNLNFSLFSLPHPWKLCIIISIDFLYLLTILHDKYLELFQIDKIILRTIYGLLDICRTIWKPYFKSIRNTNV